MVSEQSIKDVDEMIRRTYHDERNLEYLPMMLFLTVIISVTPVAIPVIPVMWLYYVIWCKHNNKKLESNKSNLFKRRMYQKLRKDLINLLMLL